MKKILSIVLALVMVCALSVSVFAEEVVLFDNPEGDRICVTPDGGQWPDPWAGFGVGTTPVNDKNVGDLSLEDVIAYAQQGASIVMVYSSIGCWGAPAHPEIQFNCWDNEEAYQLEFVNTDNGDGTFTGVANLGDVLANYEAGGGDVSAITNCGIQLWSEDFKLYKLYISTDAVIAPSEPETPAEETPAEETPAEETPTEETPAETGIVLCVLPMAVAAAAVVLSKKR